MLLINGALFLGLFMMGTFVKKFDLLVECESIPMQHDDPGPNYEDTREFYSVSSLKKANNESTIIKLVLVVDHDLYGQLQSNTDKVSLYCQKILMLANSLFQPYNIFIALVDIVIWAENDKIDIVTQYMYRTRTKFEEYARGLFKNNHSIDHVVLLSQKFNLSEASFTQPKIVDKTCNFSTEVINTNINAEYSAAQLIFLFSDGRRRIEINDDLRECFEPVEDGFKREFEEYLKDPTKYKKKDCIEKFMNTSDWTINFSCLKAKPDILYKKPVCGNNETEPGEDCDCMWLNVMEDSKVRCDNQCCNAKTCRREKPNYSCAFGECCDLNNCILKKKNDICRPASASHQCDVDEYCDDEAAFCPIDKFKNKNEECSVTECNIESVDDGIVFCQGTTDYKGVCNSKGLCQYNNKIKCHSPDSQWKTYFFIVVAMILVIGIMLLSVYVYYICVKNYCFRFHNQDQQRQTQTYNSSSIDGTINDATPVKEYNQRLTATAPSSFKLGLSGHRENAASSIYDNTSEIYQQCESTSSGNYGYSARSCCSTTSSGYLMPTATNPDNQRNIEVVRNLLVPKQQAPGYYENCDKSNNKVDPIYEDCLYN